MSRLRFEHLVIIASIVAVVLGTLLFGGGPQRLPESMEQQFTGQSRSYTGVGTSALYTVLGRLGSQVERWEKRLEFLEEDVDLVVVLSPRLEPDAIEIKGLNDWVAGGGTVLVVPSAGAQNLTGGLGFRRLEGVDRPATRRVKVGEEFYRLQLGGESRLASAPNAYPAPTPVIEDEAGWIAAEAKVGRGRVVMLADRWMVSNKGLGAEENAAFVVRGLKLPEGRVAFDEYHHGFAGGQDLHGYVMSRPAGWVVWHGLAALALLVLVGARLGPPRQVHEERRRRPAEFIEAFARLCRAAGARGLALWLVISDTREAFQRRYGAFDRATIEREAGRRGRDGKRLASALDAAQRASKGALSSAELIRHEKAMDDLRALTR